jgi:osmotically-inducible protein OsmY
MTSTKYMLAIGSISAVLAVTGLTGCSWVRARQGRETGRTATQVADDQHISARVRGELSSSPVYKFAGVGVSTYDRVVQLNGFVQTEDQKRAAEEIAAQAPGATRVINDIVVQQPQLPQAQTTKPESTAPTGRINSPKAQSHDQGS